MPSQLPETTQSSYPITFKGIDNIHDPSKLPEGFVVSAINGDFNDSGIFSIRSGYTSVYAGTPHSLFSNNGETYFVENGLLKRMYSESNIYTIYDLGSNNRVSFTGIDGMIAFTNGIRTGLITNGIVNLFDDIEQTFTADNGAIEIDTFKEPLPAGTFVDNANGVLYILAEEGDETWLYHTDPYDWTRIDSRDSYFRFVGKPTLLATVSDGVYVGAGNNVYFIDMSQEVPSQKTVLNSKAVKYASCKIPINRLPDDITSNEVVAFLTDEIILGLDSGQTINLSYGMVRLPKAEEGALTFVDEDGKIKLVCVLQGDSGNSAQYQTRTMEMEN